MVVTTTAIAAIDFDLVNMVLSCFSALGLAMHRLVTAADGELHGPKLASPTSHEDGRWFGLRYFGVFFACSEMIAERHDRPATNCFRVIFLGVARLVLGLKEGASHEHGIENEAHFDEVLGVFNTNPTRRKVIPMTKSVNTNSVKPNSAKLRSAFVALAVVMAGASQAIADPGPTMQEKMACRADAETLCSQFIGKAPQMRACLAQNKAKLSTPCRQVVQAHGG
jgi:hypothetical protein